jgi:tRNA-dihydrouridine synthase A
MNELDRRISVAPMMDWTDRHCRFFLRGFSPHILLYTEMITSSALLRGDAERLLMFHPQEHPIALQLGGADPHQLAAAARLGAEHGYDEINLNCGCPSDKVVAGTFGASLMNEPRRVADCVAAMREAVSVPVTVKMRIGTVAARVGDLAARVQRFDEADYDALCDFVAQVHAAGCEVAVMHARKAVLGMWSPQENREIPPLRFDVVARLAGDFPLLPMVLNGGLRDVAAVKSALAWCDGVMLGREAYHRPMILAELHRRVFAPESTLPSRAALLERMARYAAEELARGERLSAIARHMLGLYAHEPGAREYRRMLSDGARGSDAGPALLRLAGQRAESAGTLPRSPLARAAR